MTSSRGKLLVPMMRTSRTRMGRRRTECGTESSIHPITGRSAPASRRHPPLHRSRANKTARLAGEAVALAPPNAVAGTDAAAKKIVPIAITNEESQQQVRLQKVGEEVEEMCEPVE